MQSGYTRHRSVPRSPQMRNCGDGTNAATGQRSRPGGSVTVVTCPDARSARNGGHRTYSSALWIDRPHTPKAGEFNLPHGHRGKERDWNRNVKNRHRLRVTCERNCRDMSKGDIWSTLGLLVILFFLLLCLWTLVGILWVFGGGFFSSVIRK